MNTMIRYEYRDGANYKRSASWTVSGQCSQVQAAALRAECLHEDGLDYFVPSAVGMPDPHPAEWDDDIDHPMCHVVGIEMVGGPADDVRTMHAMVSAFRDCDFEAASARMALDKAA